MGLKYWVLNLAYAKWSMRKDIRKFVIVKGHITGTFYFSKHFNREAYDIKGDCLPQADLGRT